MSDEIIAALIGFAGIVVTALIGYVKVSGQRAQTQLAENELRTTQEGLSFAAFLGDWQNTSKEMSALIAETEIDRILILKAWNGKLNPRWTTSTFQLRAGGQEPRQYIHFELDADYVGKLKHMIANNSLSFTVADIPESFIRSVYEAEGVKSSYWSHIESRKRDNAGTSISYASFSSHTADAISPETQTRCMILTGRLKGLAANFHAEQGISEQ